MKLSIVLSAFTLLSAARAAPSFLSTYENDGVKSLKNNRGGDSIIDRLREDRRFSRFVEIVEKERGLRDELEGGKETTLFAPTNEAFKHMEDKWRSTGSGDFEERIRDILKYHIAPESTITHDCLHAGALIPTDLRLKSLDDRHQRIRVFRFNDQPWLNMQARVEGKDIEAGNGRIFAIDRVLMPPQSAIEQMWSMPTVFSTFSLALERTGLCREVAKEKGITVFAPSNEAWRMLGLENLKYLFSCVGQKTGSGSGRDSQWDRDDDRNRERQNCKGTEELKKIMEMHVATDLAYSTDMMKNEKMKLKTLGHNEVTVCAKRREGGGQGESDRWADDRRRDEHNDVRHYNFVLNNGESRIQFTDGLACNGAIQMIDSVMIPKGVKLPHDRGISQ